VRRTRTTGWLALGLGGIVVFALAAAPLAAQNADRAAKLESAKRTLERANRWRADLDGTPKDQRQAEDYLKVIRLYRKVYDTAPASNMASIALSIAAEMYHEMGGQFGAEYWREAIVTYEFLRKEYPNSRYGDDALFNVAQIQFTYLKEHEAARANYQALLRQYPKSRYAGKAREALKLIDKELATGGTPAPPTAAPPGRGRVQVRNVRYWNAKDFTRVVIDLESEVKYQEARIANPDRIFLDLFQTELSTVLSGKSFELGEGLLNRIRVAENRAGVTRVVLEVSHADNYSVFSLPNPFRLVVDILGPEAATERAAKPAGGEEAASAKPPLDSARGKPASESEGPKETARMSESLPRASGAPKPTREGQLTNTRALGLKIGRIVLDPGHGGHDTGTIGPTGFMEKDLVLDVARRLGKLLQEQVVGAQVVYTREDDTFVPLENRTALANEQQADLFLSIHANSSRDASVRGVETFYLNFTTDQEALDLAARENALSQSSVHELQDLVQKIANNEKVEESRELAREIQSKLHAELRKSSRAVQNRGVKKAPFVVLIGANMPSVLAEISFLSNPDDEQLLKSPAGRQAVAEALFRGVTKYLENLNSVALAGTPERSAPQQ
jgi:N-acetylmuramoyl-L-alanine amidase